MKIKKKNPWMLLILSSKITFYLKLANAFNEDGAKISVLNDIWDQRPSKGNSKKQNFSTCQSLNELLHYERKNVYIKKIQSKRQQYVFSQYKEYIQEYIFLVNIVYLIYMHREIFQKYGTYISESNLFK